VHSTEHLLTRPLPALLDCGLTRFGRHLGFGSVTFKNLPLADIEFEVFVGPAPQKRLVSAGVYVAFSTNHREASGMKKSLAILLVAGIAALTPTFASAQTRPTVDSSDAVRYNVDGSTIGTPIYSFISYDDATKTLDSPFPINFFGVRFSALCVSTNGVVIPVTTSSDTCVPKYDKSLEVQALASKSSSISPLALDLSMRDQQALHNPHRELDTELSVQSITATSSELTVTTTEPHGFLVDDRILKSFGTDFVYNGAGCYFYDNALVTSVVSGTSFKISSEDCTPGTYSPAAGSRAVVFRKTAQSQVSAISLSGDLLTVTTNSNHGFGEGRKFTFTGTGITGLDGAKLTTITTNGRDFTATVPSGVTDLDPDQAGPQTSVSFSTNRPWALERDDYGAISQVFFGSTTVDGRDAIAITWYRIPTYDTSADNPRTLSTTVQLVIIKATTGSDTNGWDFIYEYNIGHARDLSDGYLSTNGTQQCSMSDRTLCRWGMGTGQYLEGPGISTITYAAPNITFNTATPHGRAVGEYVMGTRLCDFPPLCDKPLKISQVIDDDTFIVQDPDASSGDNFTVRTFAGAKLAYSRSYELFPSFSILQLGDSGGTTALIRNSLNSSVAGRYTLAMTAGVITNFRVPAMDGVIPQDSQDSSSEDSSSEDPADEAPALAATGMDSSKLGIVGLAGGGLIAIGLVALFARNRRNEVA
jgi:hypothetical protein